MKTIKSFYYGLCTALILLAVMANATLYVQDSVPVGGTDYTTTGNLYGQSSTTPMGYSSNWGGSSGMGIMQVSPNGLEYPAWVPLVAEGGAFQVKHAQNQPLTYVPSYGRTLSRALANMPDGTSTIYMSMLLQYGSDTVFNAFDEGCWSGAGIARTTTTGAIYPPATGVSFAFDKANGVVRLVGRVMDTNYPLLENPVAGQTYFCVARIQIDPAGMDHVDFAVDQISFPEGATVEAQILEGTEKFGYLVMGGCYSVSGQCIFFDEIRVGETYVDVTGRTATPEFSGPAQARAAGGAITLDAELSPVSTDAWVNFFWGETDGGNDETQWTYQSTPVLVQSGQTTSHVLPNLTAGTSYYYNARASNDTGIVWASSDSSTLYNGDIWLVKTVDAKEFGLVPGTVTVHRASAQASALTVAYTVEGTAIPDRHYSALSGEVVIPAGAANAVVEILPLAAYAGVDTVCTVHLAEGGYFHGTPPSVDVIIESTDLFAEYNVWIGSGNASDAGNWSGGVPLATDHILLSDASVGNMVWYAGVNGLPDTVASWTQLPIYTGTVTFTTTYSTNVFPVFTVTGDVELLGGAWTHPVNAAAQVSRLSVRVNGNMAIGPGASINATARGYASNNGPGNTTVSGYGGGAAHAGEAWENDTTVHEKTSTYGCVLTPADLGSAARGNRLGGGAVWLVVDGHFALDGVVSANGGGGGHAQGGGASGGSIFVQCASLSGSGSVTANGGEDTWHGGGGGGRIAIVSGGASAGSVTCQAIGGNHSANPGPGTVFYGFDATNGTVVVDNSPRNVGLATHLPARRVADHSENLDGSDWVAHKAKLSMQTDAYLKSLTLADSAASLLLNGRILAIGAFTDNGVSYPPGLYLAGGLGERVMGDGLVSVGGYSIATNCPPGVSGAQVTLNGDVVWVDGATEIRVYYGSRDGEGDPGAWEFFHTVTNAAETGLIDHTITPDTSKVFYRFAAVNAAGVCLTHTTTFLELSTVDVSAVAPSANKETNAAGQFKITRSAVSELPMFVNVAFSGTTVNGVDFASISSVIEIPAGKDHAFVDIVPIGRWYTNAVQSVITIQPGSYSIGANDTAAVTFDAIPVPQGFNTWLGGDAADPATWSGGLPAATDHVLVSGWAYGSDMVWNTPALPDTVASWTQTDRYTSTVQFNTTYGAVFPVFTITGNAFLDGGVWTHPQNGTTPVYWLNIAIGGNFTMGTNGVIDLFRKGFQHQSGPGHHAGRTGASYGGQAWGDQYPTNTLVNVNFKTYGSILDPRELGSASNENSANWRGAGAVRLDIGGTFDMNGVISANGYGAFNNNGGTSGGSVNICARAMAPASSGVIEANGGIDGHHGHGSGGRIAVCLLQGEIPTGLTATAYGHFDTQGGASKRSSAGTIYYETPSGKTVVIANNGDVSTAKTALPARLRTTDTANIISDDAIADFKLVDVRIIRGAAMIEHDIAFNKFSIEYAPIPNPPTDVNFAHTVNLNGKTLCVKYMDILGERIRSGIYSDDTLPYRITDSSAEQTGQLVVGDNETILLVR